MNSIKLCTQKNIRAIKEHMLSAVLTLFIGAVFSCSATYQEVRTQDAPEAEVTGTYTLILYGGTYGNDLQKVAILNKEDAAYPIVPYAPRFEYQVIKHVPAREALARAYNFVSFHPEFLRSELARIVDTGTGALLGYEIRPLYRVLAYGYEDVLYIDYWKDDGKVFVRMRLNYDVDRMLYDGSGHGRGW